MKQLIAFVMIAFLLPTTVAYAKNPCRDDKAKFCKDVKASGGKVSDCLEKHMNELSAACKEKLATPKSAKPGKEEKDKKSGDAKTGETPATTTTEPPASGGAGAGETKP